MPAPGLLPASRPLSANYGEDLLNERPVEDPTRELDADNLNKMKADTAYTARLSAIYFMRITNGGAAVVAAVRGPESAVPANVTATRTALGVVTLDWTATGITAADIAVTPRHATSSVRACVVGLTATGCTIKTYDATTASTAIDCDFAAWLH